MSVDRISELVKLARYNMKKRAFVDAATVQGGGMPPGGAPPMPPGGGMPMDPAMMGGAPPMDPAMMGGMPMDPAMMGGMPMDPAMMDPAMMGGAPPMDPAMMDPAMAGGAAPPADPTQQDITETIRQVVKEELASAGGGAGGSGKSKGGGKVNMEQDLSTIKAVLSQIADVLGLQVPASTTLGGGAPAPAPSGDSGQKAAALVVGRSISLKQAGQERVSRARDLATALSRKHV